jgi:methionyl-tRNA formyltransferase
MNVPVYQLDNLNSQEATKLVSSLSIDVCICALDQILKSCHVSEFPKLLNVHYGHLPYIKGASAAEWSLVEESSLSISLHEIDEGIDTGEILSVTSVDISEISSLSELRNQIQEYIPTIFLNYLTAGSSYKNQIVGSDEGKLYTFMHPELLEIVNKRLKQ